MSLNNPSIVWFRRDLRLEDHPALSEAAKRGPIIPLFIWAPEEEKPWAPGAASRWWLHHALISLKNHLHKRDLSLVIRAGKSLDVLREMIQETNAQALFFHRGYEPAIQERDLHIQTTLQQMGIEIHMLEGTLLTSPEEILNRQGKPFQVFTPFWRACQRETPRKPLSIPHKLVPYPRKLSSLPIQKLSLLPSIPWDTHIAKQWDPSLEGAHEMLRSFHSKAPLYVSSRDYPSVQGTSRLSPYLHTGQLSIHTVWHAIEEPSYQRQLYWRDFAHHLLHHYPSITKQPLHPKFKALSWTSNKKHLHAWQKGLTGYPIVDAGMRELWAIGWMHNRVRMIVGSFLVKDLLIHWLEGAKWFWDTLVDADLANNTFGWQWVAGTGADAAPFFRIFNPVTQGEKFDSEGIYIRKWLPELSLLPNKWIHRPWEAPLEILQEANLILGKTYPHPLVDHKEARKKALCAYHAL